MSELFKFKQINLEGLPKIKGILKDFSSVKQIGNGKKFVSTSLKTKLNHLSKISDFSNGFNAWGFLQLSIIIEAKSSYEKLDSNADTFRVLHNLERGIQSVLNASPVLFEVFFSDQDRAIKCRFFFVNYSSITGKKAVSGKLSEEKKLKLENNIKSRVSNLENTKIGNFFTHQVEYEDCNKVIDQLEESNTADYYANKFSALMNDPFYRQAITRSLKGLDAKRANILIDTFNGLINVSEVSTSTLDIPKKHKKDHPIQKKAEHSPDDEMSSIDDILSI